MIAAVVVVVVLLLLLAAFVRSRRSGESLTEAPQAEPIPEPQDSAVADPPRQFSFVSPDGQDQSLSAEILAAHDSLLFKAGDEPQGALSRGEVVRVIGPQHLIDGLKAGVLQPTLTSTGALGVVKGPNGQFVGHLRFGSAMEAKVPATVAGPLLLFQAASVVTMQYYLHQITTRLMDIQSGIDDLKRALSAQTAGKIRAAASMVEDLEGFLHRGIALNADDRSKLQHAEAGVREAHEELRHKLSGFGREVDAAVAADDSIRPGVDKATLKKLLTTTADDAARDALLAMEATVVRVRLMRLRAFAEMDSSPERLEAVRENLERELAELRDAYDQLRGPFDQLNLRRRTVEDKWIGNAGVAELEHYREKTRQLRALVRSPPRRVLPERQREEPYIVELRQGPHGLESRYALIEGQKTG